MLWVITVKLSQHETEGLQKCFSGKKPPGTIYEVPTYGEQSLPGTRHSQPRHCLEGHNSSRNHSNQKFQCSSSLPAVLFSTADSAFKSILVTVLPYSFYFLWFLFTVFLKASSLNVLLQNNRHTPLPPTSPFQELKYSAMEQLILTLMYQIIHDAGREQINTVAKYCFPLFFFTLLLIITATVTWPNNFKACLLREQLIQIPSLCMDI